MKNSPQPDPSAFEPEIRLDPVGPRYLTESQARAHRELAAIAELAGHHHPYGGVRPRTKPLLVGSTGVGKTAVVTRLADTLARPGQRYPFLSINTGGWIVFGARAQPATLTNIRTFIRTNQYGILFLDELDKSTSSKAWTDPWYCTVTAELLALLDGGHGDTRLLTADWNQSDIDRLSQFLVIGAGAWQRHLAKVDPNQDSHLQAIHDDSGIPEELIYRFNSRLVYIQAPTRKDYQATFTRIYGDLGLPLPVDQELEALISAATSSRSGMRFCEQHVSDLLCAHPKLRQQASSKEAPKASKDSSEAAAEKSEPSRKFQTVPQAFIETRREQVYVHMASLEPDVMHVAALFGLYRRRFQAISVVDRYGSPVKSAQLEHDFMLFLDGLRHGYSLDDKERHRRQAYLWLKGDHVYQAVYGAIQNHAEFLRQQDLLALFTRTCAGISRFLAAWEFVASLRPSGSQEES